MAPSRDDPDQRNWWGVPQRASLERLISLRNDMVDAHESGDVIAALSAAGYAISVLGSTYASATQRFNHDRDPNESLGLKKVLSEALSPDQLGDVLQAKPVQELAAFTPRITSTRDPSGNLHRSFASTLDRFGTHGSRARQAGEKLATVLYMVRSTTMHGLKSLPRHDERESKRNREVAGVIVPAVDVTVDACLDYPNLRLAVYGTLAPGRENHGVVASLNGTWCEGSIPGDLGEWNGYPTVRWRAEGSAIPVSVLMSADLALRWRDLDAFEGTAYRRRWLPVDLASGAWVAASCYEAA